MDLFKVINSGIHHSGVFDREASARLAKLMEVQRYQVAAIEEARAQWINALVTDETRSWLSISEQDRPVITGLVSVLTLAAVAKMHDNDGSMDSLEIRVIRGAISAATQCAESSDCVISAEHAQAFSSAATHAKSILAGCTREAIVHSAKQLHNLVHSKVH